MTEARRLLVSLGAERLGLPDEATRESIERIEGLEMLERLIRGTFTASTWQDLLADAPRC